MRESACRFSFLMGRAAAVMFQRRASRVEMQAGDEARVKPRHVWTVDGMETPTQRQAPTWWRIPARHAFATLHLSLDRISVYFGTSPSQALRVQVDLRALGSTQVFNSDVPLVALGLMSFPILPPSSAI
jgi:hypothetical protein